MRVAAPGVGPPRCGGRCAADGVTVGGDRRVVCATGDLEVGQVRRFEIDAGAIALVHCNSGFRALVDVCSHEDYPLSEGEVFADVCEIECLRHGSTFSLLDGSRRACPPPSRSRS